MIEHYTNSQLALITEFLRATAASQAVLIEALDQ